MQAHFCEFMIKACEGTAHFEERAMWKIRISNFAFGKEK